MNSTVSFFSQFSIVKINYFPLSAHTLGNTAFIPCGRLIFLGPAHPKFPTLKKKKKKIQNSPLREQSRKGKIYSQGMQFSGTPNTVSFFLLLYYVIKGQ